MPRNAQRVMVMEFVAASPKGILFTFQLAIYMSVENHPQPITASPIHGIMTPHTVMEETPPVYFGPPKLRMVASQSTPIVAIAVKSGSSVVPRNPQA